MLPPPPFIVGIIGRHRKLLTLRWRRILYMEIQKLKLRNSRERRVRSMYELHSRLMFFSIFSMVQIATSHIFKHAI